jgi:hypothetical protein
MLADVEFWKPFRVLNAGQSTELHCLVGAVFGSGVSFFIRRLLEEGAQSAEQVIHSASNTVLLVAPIAPSE